MAHSIRTETLVAAPPAAVWQVLTEFEAPREWDPFIGAIDGQARVGDRLRVRFRRGMTFRPTVTEVRPGRLLEWLGRLFIPGLFTGRHRFELVPEGDGTRLVHSERFTGLLVPVFRRMLAETEREFGAFNAALKARVESMAG